jgi:hypothetical protein
VLPFIEDAKKAAWTAFFISKKQAEAYSLGSVIIPRIWVG